MPFVKSEPRYLGGYEVLKKPQLNGQDSEGVSYQKW